MNARQSLDTLVPTIDVHTPLTTASTVRVSPYPVWQDLEGETVILDPTGGIYYGLDSIGSRVWRMIQRPVAVADISRTLSTEYDVEPARCEADLLALLRQMASAGLIVVVEGRA